MGTKSWETIYGASVRAAAEPRGGSAQRGRPARLRCLEPLPIATEYFAVLFVGVVIGYQQSAGFLQVKGWRVEAPTEVAWRHADSLYTLGGEGRWLVTGKNFARQVSARPFPPAR
jgi:hypothetical protein